MEPEHETDSPVEQESTAEQETTQEQSEEPSA